MGGSQPLLKCEPGASYRYSTPSPGYIAGWVVADMTEKTANGQVGVHPVQACPLGLGGPHVGQPPFRRAKSAATSSTGAWAS